MLAEIISALPVQRKAFMIEDHIRQDHCNRLLRGILPCYIRECDESRHGNLRSEKVVSDDLHSDLLSLEPQVQFLYDLSD